MKHYLALLLLLLPAVRIAAQNGIQFEHELSLDDALAKAKAEGKGVFMDAYTTWCGPCRLMASKTFTDSALGAYFNARFVNLKMDMEKGEGPALALRYGVEYYPTLLFLNPDGARMHKVVGYYNAGDFLRVGTTAMDPAANLLALETRYRQGERSADLLRTLTEAKSSAVDASSVELANDYLKTQADLGTPENMDFIMHYLEDPYAQGFRYLQEKRAAFEARFSPKEVKQKIDAIFENYLQNHSNLQLGEIQRLYGVVYPEHGERLASNYRLTYYRKRGDMENFAKSAVDHYKRYPSDDADELNEMAFLFLQNLTDQVMLEKALDWARQSVAIRETSYNQDTLARLYLKLGKKKQAAAAARRSIELAKSAGEDASMTVELLEKINGK